MKRHSIVTSGNKRHYVLALAAFALLGAKEVQPVHDTGSSKTEAAESASKPTEYNEIAESLRGIRAALEAQAAQADPADERRNAKDDLEAQQLMAWWSRAMGITAIAGTLLSGVGVFLIYGTWRQTQRAVEEAKKAADEAKRSADAFIESERARIDWSCVAADISIDGSTLDLTMRLFNYGRLPCSITEIKWATFNGMNASFPGNDFTGIDHQTREPQLIVKANEKEFITLDNAPDSIQIGGYIKYTTAFRPECFTYFRVHLTPTKEGSYSRTIKNMPWPNPT